MKTLNASIHIKTIIIYTFLLLSFAFTASAISVLDAKIGDVISDNDFIATDFSTDKVQIVGDKGSVSGDYYNFEYSLKTIIDDDGVNKVGTSDFTATVYKEQWNECRASKSAKDCYAEIKQSIIDKAAIQRQEETKRLEAIQEELKLQDYWGEFDPEQISITDEELN